MKHLLPDTTPEPSLRVVQPWDTPDVGQVLGAYRIVRRIGSGGMAYIYEAEHVKLRRRVALKLLRPEMARRAEELARFFEEARAVNEIRHPNIVDVFDFVEDTSLDPPMLYMVMELLEGEDLAARIRRQGPLAAQELVPIMIDVLGGLRAAHEANILHRDLKPSNIFLAHQEDGSIRPKLLDFGLAKAFGTRASRGLTNPRLVAGTPEYMAPEQIMNHPLDGRMDLYNVGLVLYEALSAHRPFSGDQDTEILIKHVTTPARPLGHWGTPCPAGLEATVMRCLSKDPDERYGSAGDLEEALIAGHTSNWSAKSRRLLPLALLALVVFGALLAALALREPPSPHAAAPARNAEPIKPKPLPSATSVSKAAVDEPVAKPQAKKKPTARRARRLRAKKKRRRRSPPRPAKNISAPPKAVLPAHGPATVDPFEQGNGYPGGAK